MTALNWLWATGALRRYTGAWRWRPWRLPADPFGSAAVRRRLLGGTLWVIQLGLLGWTLAAAALATATVDHVAGYFVQIGGW